MATVQLFKEYYYFYSFYTEWLGFFTIGMEMAYRIVVLRQPELIYTQFSFFQIVVPLEITL